jgi:hypothetical protein
VRCSGGHRPRGGRPARRREDYDSAWAAKDTAIVGRVLAPAYTYFTSVGGLSDRAASLGFLADTSYVLTLSRRSEVELTIRGAVGRVSSRWEGEGRFQGEAVLDDQTCGQIWLWERSRWLLFTEHARIECLRSLTPRSPA